MIKSNMVAIVISLINEGKPITMEDVANRCGVSKGTIYNYFSDRRSLLDHVHAEIIRPLREIGEEIFKGDMMPLDKIHAFVNVVMEMPDYVKVYFRFIGNERTVAQEEREKYEMITKPLSEICAEGIKRGEFINVHPSILAEMINGIVVGTLGLVAVADSQLPDNETMNKDFIKLINQMVIKERSDI
ncbi:TetR/AcrR family transcriptional regulator [Deferribacteres bacterium DY0609]